MAVDQGAGQLPSSGVDANRDVERLRQRVGDRRGWVEGIRRVAQEHALHRKRQSVFVLRQEFPLLVGRLLHDQDRLGGLDFGVVVPLTPAGQVGVGVMFERRDPPLQCLDLLGEVGRDRHLQVVPRHAPAGGEVVQQHDRVDQALPRSAPSVPSDSCARERHGRPSC